MLAGPLNTGEILSSRNCVSSHVIKNGISRILILSLLFSASSFIYAPSTVLYATPAASAAWIHIMTSSPLVTCSGNLSTLASTLLGTQAVELFTMAKLFEYSARNVAASAMKSGADGRSEEHTSELQSLMRISY